MQTMLELAIIKNIYLFFFKRKMVNDESNINFKVLLVKIIYFELFIKDL